jgi:hypothetical protein
MKTIIYLSLFAFFNLSTKSYANSDKLNLELETILNELVIETNAISLDYIIINNTLLEELSDLKAKLSETGNMKKQVAFLIKKEKIEEKLRISSMSEASKISKVRYLKGLQIIKILYEKTLGLDHHFSSVATFNEINKLSNPNNYPEFIKLKGNITPSKEKKVGFKLPTILSENIYTSVAFSIVSLFNNSSTKRNKKEENLKGVECILDFTLRMHNDLNTIYFETAFLKKSNDNIIKELEQLFIDYTKPIKYNTPIDKCRSTDDWDTIREHLNKYLEDLNKAIENDSKRIKAHRMQINLEFPIDRLLQFITLYNLHIDQGGKFYEKFGIMLNSYENETQCATEIPLEYSNLKENIKTSIEKFNTAYKPVEINGSKMKQILYGINEYD